MKLPRLLATAGVLTMLCVAHAGSLAAQEDDQVFIYAVYYQCAPGSVGDAVQDLEDNWTPVMQDYIDSGDLVRWGALTHSTGNDWSLVLYHVGSDVDRVINAVQSGGGTYVEANPEAADAFGEACPSHEDYVWSSDLASEPVAEAGSGRSEAALSVYWVCDEGREAVADLIFETVSVEAWNEQVEAGLVDSWSWNEHYLGGKYRRLLAIDGPDHASLLEARENVIEAGAENPGLLAAFSDVCNGHQDNLYDVRISKP